MISTALVAIVDVDAEIAGSELKSRALAVVRDGSLDLLNLAAGARAETPSSWAA